jgi:two-component system, chemotaxis family, protein-glutamate methylesterase/glutaminase
MTNLKIARPVARGVGFQAVDAELQPGPSIGVPVRVIGIAASAGGVEALRCVVAALPAGLPAAICVVLHIPATGRSLLAPILTRDGAMPAVLAEHGQALRPGTIYVAPADRHLLVQGRQIELSRGPKENGVRPAADPLFRSLARSWGARAVAVVLSGALDDGSAGAASLADAGGTVVVQDPATAIVPGMPEAAIATTAASHVLPLDEIGGMLTRLVLEAEPEEEEATMPAEPDPTHHLQLEHRPSGPPSGFTCPECSGSLWELQDGPLTRYRCRVGHTYSEDAMVAAQGDAVEAALWTALEVLEEREELLERIAGRMGDMPRSAGRFRQAAREVADRAALLRRALSMGVGNPALTRDEVEEATR